MPNDHSRLARGANPAMPPYPPPKNGVTPSHLFEINDLDRHMCRHKPLPAPSQRRICALYPCRMQLQIRLGTEKVQGASLVRFLPAMWQVDKAKPFLMG